jgi:chromosome partitioning protein
MLGLSFSRSKRRKTEAGAKRPVTAAPAPPDVDPTSVLAAGDTAAPSGWATPPPASAAALASAPEAAPAAVVTAVPATQLAPVPAPRLAPVPAPPLDLTVENNVVPAHVSVPMQVIVFTSQKGGSGKTTLCGQLAVAAELSGNGPIALVDCDPQGSLADWWNVRSQETPVFVNSSVEQLEEHLDLLKLQGVTLVFIDTPPSVTETIREIVSHADLVVIPTRPSPHDLRAVGATLDIVDGQGKPLVFAVNAATKRARITGETAVALSQHGTVAPVTLHHRNDFATSMIKGGTVLENNPNSKSAEEVVELWRYLFTRLRKAERRRGDRPFNGIDRRNPDRRRPFGVQELQLAPTFGRRASE